jgi:hypothetical protein
MGARRRHLLQHRIRPDQRLDDLLGGQPSDAVAEIASHQARPFGTGYLHRTFHIDWAAKRRSTATIDFLFATTPDALVFIRRTRRHLDSYRSQE